jgi:hypothetical protein
MSFTPRGAVRRIGKVAAPTVAVIGVGLAFAAFTDDARNDGNQASAASVTITEDVSASSSLFNLTNFRPSDPTEQRCIGVTNGGSVAVPVTMHLDGALAGTGLGSHISMTIERGTRTTTDNTSSCATFAPDATSPTFFNDKLSAFPTARNSAIPDQGAPLPVGQERAYRIRWTLDDTETAEGKTVSDVDFVWTSSS